MKTLTHTCAAFKSQKPCALDADIFNKLKGEKAGKKKLQNCKNLIENGLHHV